MIGPAVAAFGWIQTKSELFASACGAVPNLPAGTKTSGLLPAAAATASGTHGTVEIAVVVVAAVVVVVVTAAAAAAAVAHDATASTRGGNYPPYCTCGLAPFLIKMDLRSKKDKKHKKEKKSRHRRDKDAVPRVVDAPAGNAAAHAAGTKLSPAAPTLDADALRLSAKAAPHVALDPADSVSDGDSDYGPTPLLAAVGDVG